MMMMMMMMMMTMTIVIGCAGDGFHDDDGGNGDRCGATDGGHDDDGDAWCQWWSWLCW